jgi:hypothetical protein
MTAVRQEEERAHPSSSSAALQAPGAAPPALLHAVMLSLVKSAGSHSPVWPYDCDALPLANLQVHVLEQQPAIIAVAETLRGGGTCGVKQQVAVHAPMTVVMRLCF